MRKEDSGRSHEDEGESNGRAVVLGFDGAPWPLVRRWADSGELPNFETLFVEGAAGPLASTVPPTTPMAWPSLATGASPDKHKIYGFHRLRSEYTHRMNTSEQLAAPPLWDLVNPAIVANVPMTFPASEVDGQLVAGMMAPAIDERFTHPPELAATIREEIPDYRIGLDWSDYGDNHDQFFDDLDALVSARRELMRRLLDEDWRLFFFVYTAPDRLQHLVWDESVLLDYYRVFDKILGEVMATVAERSCTLFVVSDHGFGPISDFVHVNTVLERRGFLTRKRSGASRQALDRLGVNKERVLGALERLGVSDETLVRRLPSPVVDAVAARTPGDHVLHDVDFEETTAFLHGPGHVYVNDTDRFDAGTVPPGRRSDRKEEISRVLDGLSGPDGSEQVLEVYDGADLFPTDPHAPDLVVEGGPGFQVRMSLSSDPIEPAEDVAAYHRPEGIFFAWGEDVRPGGRLEDASVVDLAPTVLHSIGEPVPRLADGSVLWTMFDPDSVPANRAVEVSDFESPTRGQTTVDDAGEVEDRLRGLGYLE